MRDLAALLRSELESLEAELAADPRAQKAQKIRELLAIYSTPHPIPLSDHSATQSKGDRPPRIAKAKRPRFDRLRSILGLKRPEGTAAVARARLIAISQSNHWTNASPAWLQLPRDAMGRPLSYDNVLAPRTTSPTVISNVERPGGPPNNVQDKGAGVLSLRSIANAV